MAADQLAFGWAEERGILLVGEDGEKGFLVRDFAGEGVGDADGAGRVGFNEGGTFRGTRNDVVDEHAAIDEVDALAVRGELAGFEIEIAGIGQDRGDAFALEMRLNDFEFAPGRNFTPIHDGDYGRLVGAAPFAIAVEQSGEESASSAEICGR